MQRFRTRYDAARELSARPDDAVGVAFHERLDHERLDVGVDVISLVHAEHDAVHERLEQHELFGVDHEIVATRHARRPPYPPARVTHDQAPA